MRLKEYNNAEKMYRKALKIDPNSALIRKNLGTNLLAQHRFAEGLGRVPGRAQNRPGDLRTTTPGRASKSGIDLDRGAMNYLPCQRMSSARHASACH